MARWFYLLIAFAALSAWAGAQNPAPQLSAEDRLRLLKANSTLLDQLVRGGVALSSPDTPEKKAEDCRGSALALANAIHDAAAADDTERVAELTALFRDLVRDGLVLTINDGLKAVNPKSPAAQKLREVRGYAVDDLAKVKTRLSVGKSADNARVKESLNDLDKLANELK